MIEIKDINGKILYTAKNATNVKEALEEAVKEGARLAYARLEGANLAGANLAYATLARATLAYAKLAGARLEGANLSRARLAGARLAGARLAGANLTYATLVGANLARANLAYARLEGARLAYARLEDARLEDATLAYARLEDATLAYARLTRARLTRATLTNANLARATLEGARLTNVRGINKHRTSSLYMLADQPGKIRAYKLVNAQSEGLTKGGIKYEIGKSVSVENANTDESKHCAKGINLADLPWCMREWRTGRRILIAEFTATDIAAIPFANDGAFRVHKCKIVGEKDLIELGLVESDTTTTPGESVACEGTTKKETGPRE